jgi:peptide/nickel transport system substrate-binding protein
MSERAFQEGPQRHHDLARQLVADAQSGRISRRELITRGVIGGLSLPTLAALLSACGGGSSNSASSGTNAGSPKLGGMMRVGAIKPSTSFDPITMADGSSIMCVQLVAEYLLTIGTGFVLQPSIAESWSPDASAKTWTFKIRQDVKFNDGQPLTAADVAASFERLVDPKSESSALSNFAGLFTQGNTEVVDDHTVVFHLQRSFADWPYMVSPANFNAVVLPKNYDGQWSKNPVGSGPYTMTQYAPAQSASFKRRPDYWGDRPYLDTIGVTFYTDPQAEALAIQAGSIDLAIDVDPSLYSAQNVELIDGKSAGYLGLDMRVDKAPFSDKRVRQAVAYCLERNQVIQAVAKGKATIGNDHLFASLYPIQPTGLPQRNQDYAKAKQLLTEAGMASGFSATLTIDDEPGIPDYAALVKEMCRPAGISIDIQQMSSSAFYGSGNNQPWLQADMTIVPWGGRPVPEQAIEASTTCQAVWNSAHFCSSTLDDAIHKYDATLDKATRVELATQVAQIMQDETPTIIAFFQDFLQATTPQVEGITPAPVGNIVLTKAWMKT